MTQSEWHAFKELAAEYNYDLIGMINALRHRIEDLLRHRLENLEEIAGDIDATFFPGRCSDEEARALC